MVSFKSTPPHPLFDAVQNFSFLRALDNAARDALFYGFPSAQRLEKEVQLHLVRVFRDVYQEGNQIMEGQLPFSGEIGRFLFVAGNEFV